MATFFGEVILPSSRAFWDDSDDSESEHEGERSKCKRLEVVKTESYEVKSCYELLVVVDGPVSSSFATNYLLSQSSKLIATLETPSEDEDPVEAVSLGRRVKWQAAMLYLINENSLLLRTNASRPIDIGVANDITVFVSPWLEKCKKVLVLCSRPTAEFKYDRSSGSVMPDSFIRCLSSSIVPTMDNGITTRLEQPNFLTGVSASVLSWCEVKKIECLLYVCYTDSVFYNASSISPFATIFFEVSSPFAHLIVNKNPNLTSQLPNSHLTSLYF